MKLRESIIIILGIKIRLYERINIEGSMYVGVYENMIWFLINIICMFYFYIY